MDECGVLSFQSSGVRDGRPIVEGVRANDRLTFSFLKYCVWLLSRNTCAKRALEASLCAQMSSLITKLQSSDVKKMLLLFDFQRIVLFLFLI